ncbi:hypothetical protein ABDK56_03870 [Sphingomonas sp. ASV193]|uniref:hypothetical protein n=1 Tax=Sphingomonas sp. ASV193 TaxID=3144405 RepID=UPI0032E90A5A
MQKFVCLAAAAMALTGCRVEETNSAANQSTADAFATSDLNMAANTAATSDVNMAAPAGGQLAGTSWTFKGPNGDTTATFGTDGHYYDIAGGKLVESGTYVESGGKVCENLDGTPQDDHVCYTIPSPLPEIGKTGQSTADGKTMIDITRVAFAGNKPA